MQSRPEYGVPLHVPNHVEDLFLREPAPIRGQLVNDAQVFQALGPNQRSIIHASRKAVNIDTRQPSLHEPLTRLHTIKMREELGGKINKGSNLEDLMLDPDGLLLRLQEPIEGALGDEINDAMTPEWQFPKVLSAVKSQRP